LRAATQSADVIVIGAGAAGLAAAQELARAGCSVLVLEARDRVGGRCDTRRMPGLPVPVELGAEFIHGRPTVTLELLQKAGLPAIDASRTQRLVQRGKLVPVDAFAEAQRAVRNKAILRKADLSFSAFLDRQKRISPLTRMLARRMVEGFDAADPALASAREIVAEWGSDEMGSSQMRPLGGYRPLLESLIGNDVSLQLKSAVRALRWKPGSVEIEGEGFSIKAPRAIVTLPLGVLQAGSVRFDPPLREKARPLQRLVSGAVIRVAMRFHEAFWEERFPDVAFFHTPRAPFPIFWTPLPVHAPLLTAWAGGPKAARLTGSSNEELLRAALASVKAVFRNIPRPEEFLVQDWQADPYARGGYSYVTVGGHDARKRLAAPLERTLFFAGEATDTEGEAATVVGALQSGIRAARELVVS
jgi:monoamine oxidase